MEANATRNKFRKRAEAKKQSVRVVDIREFIEKELPPREPMLGKWLTKQSLNMVYSWRGVGKTHFALGVAYAVASGGVFLGWEAKKPHKVLYIDGEMPGPAIQSRLSDIVTMSDNEPGEGYFRLMTPDLQDICVPDLATTEGQQAIDSIIENDTDLIVIDNLSALARRGGKENEAESWLSIGEWAMSKRAQGHSLLFVHHAGKGGDQRGTSKREDILDVVICLKHPNDYDPKEGARFEVVLEKDRHYSETEPIEAKLSADELDNPLWTIKPLEESRRERILELDKEGLTQREIAEEIKCGLATVNRTLKNAKAGKGEKSKKRGSNPMIKSTAETG